MLNFGNRMEHPDVALPKAQGLPPKHPFKDIGNHEKLLCYVQSRLLLGKNSRDNKLQRMTRTDKSIAGWMRLSDEDKQRKIKQDRDGTPQALELNLPLGFVHLDDMMTYFVQTFSPNKGMFEHSGKPNESQPGAQIVTIMNNHSIYSGYFRQTVLAVNSILKYNEGGFHAFWSADTGPKLSKPTEGSTQVTTDTIWEGNKAEALDMYNTFWDPTVDPTQVYKDAEWCAKTFMRSHYWLQNKCLNGIYFNCEQALASDVGVNQTIYYRNPPSEARMTTQNNNGTDWAAVLSETPEYMQSTGYEIVEVYIRIVPTMFGLVPAAETKTRQKYEIWRISILMDKYIIDATMMPNIHNYLPFFMGRANDDIMGSAAKSPAEVIQPLGDFASFLLNTHVKATRKNIWGMTYYDPSVVDLSAIAPGEVAAYVPIKATAYGKDLRNAIVHDQHTLDTKQTMDDLAKVMEIINQFFPTQSLPSQIANIDRAVDSQVAAVQQGANRRMQKSARLLDDSMFRPFRFALYYNIIQFQKDGAEVADFYGKPVTIDLSLLRQTDLPFIIGQGLKALDRAASAHALQQIIFAIIQNPQVATQIDLLGLIDYWTSMIDIDIDMTQFHIQQPQVGPDGQPLAVQPPGGAIPGGAVQPVVNPQAVTAPIKKTNATQ